MPRPASRPRACHAGAPGTADPAPARAVAAPAQGARRDPPGIGRAGPAPQRRCGQADGAARGGGGPAAAGRVGQYQHRRGLPASTGPGQCRSVAGGRRCRPVCRQAGRPQPGGAARACAG
ncbi:hypothetical protein G6F32_015797 [Rhizopus arrhizus]|nr:hypothetical protein G6F32_015797 [Rhizopus arrhizus]